MKTDSYLILRALSVLEDLKVIRYLLRLDPIEGLNKLLCMNNVYLDQAKRRHLQYFAEEEGINILFVSDE